MTAKLRYTILNEHLSIQLFQNYGWLVLWYVGRYLVGTYVVQDKDSLFCIDLLTWQPLIAQFSIPPLIFHPCFTGNLEVSRRGWKKRHLTIPGNISPTRMSKTNQRTNCIFCCSTFGRSSGRNTEWGLYCDFTGNVNWDIQNILNLVAWKIINGWNRLKNWLHLWQLSIIHIYSEPWTVISDVSKISCRPRYKNRYLLNAVLFLKINFKNILPLSQSCSAQWRGCRRRGHYCFVWRRGWCIKFSLGYKYQY